MPINISLLNFLVFKSKHIKLIKFLATVSPQSGYVFIFSSALKCLDCSWVNNLNGLYVRTYTFSSNVVGINLLISSSLASLDSSILSEKTISGYLESKYLLLIAKISLIPL